VADCATDTAEYYTRRTQRSISVVRWECAEGLVQSRPSANPDPWAMPNKIFLW
jgi:hypothetical protein